MCASSHLSLSLLLCWSLWTREGDPQNRLSRLFGLTSSRRGLGRRCRHFRQRRQDRTCLPACWRGVDTSERIDRTNERVRQTAVNGVVGHLRSGSTFGDRSCCCVAGIKESQKKEVQHRRRRQHLLTTTSTSKSREIERERRRTESSYFKHTHTHTHTPAS